MDPKKLWIGAEWQAERDHYGLDKRCGMFSTERFHEDDKGYVTADLTDALVVAAEEVLKELEDAHHQDIISSRTTKALEAALAAYRGEVNG